MIAGLKGYGVKDLTQYLMEQACSCTTNTIFLSIQFTVSGIRDLWNLFCCCMSFRMLSDCQTEHWKQTF
jgi:hypothetical protein